MFFIGIFGNNSKVVPVGQISGAVCSACRKTISLHVCREYSYLHAFFIPLIKYDSVYIATCSSCASVFELSPELGKQLLRGEQVRVSSADLRLLKNNCVPRCPACGAPQSDASLFCNKCGTKL
ncbi:zinc-ribbon domain-containing protein [Oscillospiraceae bacterium PP1C4]